MKESIAIFLKQFMPIPENLVKLFIDHLELVEFKSLEFLAEKGKYANHFYIIDTGIVRSYLTCDKGNDKTRNFYVTGNITGPVASMMQQKPAMLNHQALTHVTAYKGNFNQLKQIILTHHELTKAYVLAIQNAYIRAEQNLLDISRYDATQRYLMLKEEIPNIEDKISQKYIASYLNITPVQLSRIRKKLIK